MSFNFGKPSVGVRFRVTQESAVFVVSFEGFVSAKLVGVGVAVNAAVGAGVVGSDIYALRAAAFFPGGLIIVRKAFR